MVTPEEKWYDFAKRWRRRNLFLTITFMFVVFVIMLGAVYISFFAPLQVRLVMSTFTTFLVIVGVMFFLGYMIAQFRYLRVFVMDRIFGGIEHVSWFVPVKPEEVSTRDLPDLFSPDFPETKVTIIKLGKFGKTLVFPFSSEHGVPPQYFFNEGRFIFKAYGRKASPEEFVAYLFGIPYNPEAPDPMAFKKIKDLVADINPYVLRRQFGIPARYMLVLPYAITPFLASAIESTLQEAPSRLKLVQRISSFYGAIINRLFHYIQEIGSLEKERVEDLAYSVYRVLESAAKASTVPTRLLAEFQGIEPDKLQEAGITELARQGTTRAVISAGRWAKDVVEEGARELGFEVVSPEVLKMKEREFEIYERALKELAMPPHGPKKRVVKRKEERVEEAGE